ncbi:hypothetical protein AYO45_01610 [Gammaproteobacteria bacterium SCGC AG-212-F23]|nr:hypothetical protein AYO45_01610 [Gammaproteobacteria bacterium SCGC AG-212-F23]
MSKSPSTFARKMKNPKFKKSFSKGYKKLLFSELLISLMENDQTSIRALAKETKLSKSIIQNLRSGEQTDLKASNLIRIARAFGYEIILQRKGEQLKLQETTKNSKVHLKLIETNH